MNISTDYIRGFADADGSFYGHMITLVNTEPILLEQIAKELEILGIEWKIIREKSRQENHNVKFTLRITGYKNLKRFQKYINFNHPQKRKRLSKYITRMERPGTQYNRKEAERAISLRSLGYSYRTIAKKLGIPFSTIAARFRRGQWPPDKI